jgi:hypothetical protein
VLYDGAGAGAGPGAGPAAADPESLRRRLLILRREAEGETRRCGSVFGYSHLRFGEPVEASSPEGRRLLARCTAEARWRGDPAVAAAAAAAAAGPAAGASDSVGPLPACVVVTVGGRSLWAPVPLVGSSPAAAADPPPLPDPLSLWTLRDLFASELPPLPWRERVRIAYEAWQAVHWLHTARVNTGMAIVHHDLKAGNILLNENKRALVADVGLAQHLALGVQQTHVSTPVYFGGTEGYMDPRALDRTNPRKGERNDVYSFGVLLCELFCPLQEEEDEDEEREQGQEEALQGQAAVAVAALMALGRRCTSSEWEARPTSAELLDALSVHFAAAHSAVVGL